MQPLQSTAMSQAESVSSLSTASSRSQHMAYLMNDLDLDRATAALMYRAERLQEKGQLQQALNYFERVLAMRHDCEEASVNARMIREQLAETQAPRLEPVREELFGDAGTLAVHGRLQTADIPLTVRCTDCEDLEVFFTEPMLRDVVLDQARKELSDTGIVTPFLEIISMDIERYTPNVSDDPWMNTMHTCRAVVRATLLPGAAVQQ